MSIANDIVEGLVCQFCTIPIDEPMGFPTTCNECGVREEPFADIARKLERNNIEFESKNNGQHFIVSGQETIDFWPSSEKFIVRDSNKKGQGISNLISEHKPYVPSYSIEGNKTIGKDYKKTKSNKIPWDNG